MKISVKGGGGFAGTVEHYEVDTAHLPPGDTLETLLQNLDFFHAPEPPPAVGADVQRWEITVDDGRQCRTVEFAEDGGPAWAHWKPFVDRLRGAG